MFMKHPKKTALRDLNKIVLLTIVTITDTYFLLLKKISGSRYQFTKVPCGEFTL